MQTTTKASGTQIPNTYREVSVIARKRRDANIAALYPKSNIDIQHLPNNLAEWSLQSGHYTIDELEIIQSEAIDILQKIRDQIWTALEVTQAFCKASAFAQELTNCLTEVMYAEAMERAQYLDAYLKKTGRTIGPLHGLPVSLKDNLVTAPHPTSNGLAVTANQPTTSDMRIVKLLRNAGAVFYVHTNVPTAMLMPQTINNIWGETNSPVHKGCTPGGSSGGEGAIIACFASPLGIGTDIGGSIRMPAGFCGLYGLKPSGGRFPATGAVRGLAGEEFVLGSTGPMSRSLETVRLCCETILSEQVSPWNEDHHCLPIPWRTNVIQPSGRKLRLGLVGPSDGLVTCHPPVERALAIAKASLENAGHEVVTWPIDLHPPIVKSLLAAFFDFAGKPIMAELNAMSEPVYPALQGYAVAAQASEASLGPTRYCEMVISRNRLQQAYLDLWNSSAEGHKAPIDGIVMAVSPWAAPRCNRGQMEIYFGYTGVWNFLDFAACTFPVTSVDKKVDKARNMKLFQQLSELDGKIQADYDPEFYHGAPVSLQMVGRRFEEEKVLEMVKIVSDALVQSR